MKQNVFSILSILLTLAVFSSGLSAEETAAPVAQLKAGDVQRFVATMPK